MNIIEINKDPAIIDVEFPEFERFNTDKLFEAAPSRINYGELDVEAERLTILPLNDNNEEFDNFSKELYTPLRLITKKLIELDPIRYPLFDSPNFDLWYTKRFASRVKIGFSRIIDSPGFHQSWHIDNRFVLLSGIINLQDNETQTHFASERIMRWMPEQVEHEYPEKIRHRGRNKKWQGTFWLNTETQWHCVPLVTTTRKILLCNLFL